MSDTITFEQFKDVWLSDVRAGSPSTTDLGHRFAQKILAQWLDVGEGTEDPVYCDGAGDGGIDIAYLHRKEAADADAEQATGDTWYLVQSKYGSAFRGTKTLLEEGQKVIDSLDGKRTKLSSLAAGLLERLTTFRQSASERDRIVLVFAAEDPLTEEQKRALDDVKSMGVGRLGTLFDVDAVSLATIYKRSRDELAGADALRIKVTLAADLVASGQSLLVGSTSLIDLYDFLKRYRKTTQDLDQLYEKNVRRFLGGKGKVNKAMQATLREHPEQFGLFNNGITITVADFQMTDKGYELLEPYVVNGCQTTRTIWEVCQLKLEAGGTGSSPELESWRHRLMQGVVVTKVVRVGSQGEEMLQAITRYTNSQNAVKEKDFLTLTNDFRTWSRQMAEQYNVFLEVQRGGWESRRALQKQRPELPKFEHAANAFDLLKVYGAGWLREPGTAFGRNAAFLPNGSIFKRIMEPSEAPFGVDDLYAAYRLQTAADGYGFGRAAAADKPGRRQTRFLFYLVANDLLRDVMTRAQIPVAPKAITRAWLRLFAESNADPVGLLLDNGIEVIDEYMNKDVDDSIEKEPGFEGTGRDLNAFLKSEGFGKNEETSPRLRSIISGYARTMARGVGGQKSAREQITAAVKF